MIDAKRIAEILANAGDVHELHKVELLQLVECHEVLRELVKIERADYDPHRFHLAWKAAYKLFPESRNG